MKIRTDFVTNSSSVSYILTMNEDIVKGHLKYYKGLYEKGEDIITKFLMTFISEKGTRVFIENEEIYTYKIHFNTDEMMLDSDLELPPDRVDFSSMDGDDLWAYIFGEYIYQGRLKNIDGFGITKTETF